MQMDSKILREISPQSSMLARQAKRELEELEYVTTVCPKCHEKLEITTTSRGERTIVSCKCRYILDAEIYF